MNIAIVGATGNVGRKILEVLEKKELSVENVFLLASSKSEGSKINFKGKEHEVLNLKTFDFSKVKITFFAAGGKISEIFAEKAARDSIVIDNSSFYRMDPDVPLIVPQVNSNHLNNNFCPALLEDATKYNFSKGRFFFSNTSSVFLPTFPVAPTIAIFIVLFSFYTR